MAGIGGMAPISNLAGAGVTAVSGMTPGRAREAQKTYRPDAGQNMTDAEYQAWQTQRPLTQLKATGDIETGLMKSRGDIETGQTLQRSTDQANLQAQAEQRRLGYIPQLLSNATSALQLGGGGSKGLPEISQASTAGEDAARAAAFARAKDIAGQTGRSALTALQNVMGARGLTGTGIGATGAANVIGAGASQLADVNREQLIQDLANARARASEAYQGAIAQRGQDVALRGQNLNMMQSLTSPLYGLITARY